jgi:hypothetical protein
MKNQNKIIECKNEVARSGKKLKDLQDHSDFLEGLLHKAQFKKQEKLKIVQAFEFELRSLGKQKTTRDIHI